MSRSAFTQAMIVGLMRRCGSLELKYLVRVLVANLRIGATLRTVLAAFARAAVLVERRARGGKDEVEGVVEGGTEGGVSEAEAVALVRDAHAQCPSVDEIVQVRVVQRSIARLRLCITSSRPAPQRVLTGGTASLRGQTFLRPGVPVKPMLAKVCTGAEALLAHFKGAPFCCEYKYDGQRVQVRRPASGSHRSGALLGWACTHLVHAPRSTCSATAAHACSRATWRTARVGFRTWWRRCSGRWLPVLRAGTGRGRRLALTATLRTRRSEAPARATRVGLALSFLMLRSWLCVATLAPRKGAVVGQAVVGQL